VKALTTSATRRQALRASEGGLAGGLLATFGTWKQAWAGNGWDEACQEFCKDLRAHALGQCVNSCVACLKGVGEP
jgi:hypothetical protein